MVKLSIKERREQFLFFIAIFVFTIGLLSFGLFHDYGDGRTISKEDLAEKLSQDVEFEELVKDQRPTVDTTFKEVIRFDPGVQASFLENDIKNSLSSIKANYQRRAADPRYKTFLHVSDLYNDLFFDRRELKGNNKDYVSLSKSLEDCKLSTRQLRQILTSASGKR